MDPGACEDMSLSDPARKRVIDYYFKAPNTKAVLEDGLDVARADVEDFLEVTQPASPVIASPTRAEASRRPE